MGSQFSRFQALTGWTCCSGEGQQVMMVYRAKPSNSLCGLREERRGRARAPRRPSRVHPYVLSTHTPSKSHHLSILSLQDQAFDTGLQALVTLRSFHTVTHLGGTQLGTMGLCLLRVSKGPSTEPCAILVESRLQVADADSLPTSFSKLGVPELPISIHH